MEGHRGRCDDREKVHVAARCRNGCDVIIISPSITLCRSGMLLIRL
jgi:hypothetical protein